MTDLSERLARLEGAFQSAMEGIRHSQNMTLTAVIGVGVILGGLGVYILQRIDALPAEFERLSATLAETITAAKQTPPQVILVPAPQPAKK